MSASLLDIVFVIGLPRSGTSLVHKLLHEATGRKAPTFKSFGVDVSHVPASVRSLNPTFKDGTSLAEDNDFPRYPDLRAYRKWLDRREDRWVLKSPDHIGRLPELIDVFPDAKFLWCMRPGKDTLASILEYWQVTGMAAPYNIDSALTQASYFATEVMPERFSWVWTPSIPEWESERVGRDQMNADYIDKTYNKVKGICRHVASRDFTKYY